MSPQTRFPPSGHCRKHAEQMLPRRTEKCSPHCCPPDGPWHRIGTNVRTKLVAGAFWGGTSRAPAANIDECGPTVDIFSKLGPMLPDVCQHWSKFGPTSSLFGAGVRELRQKCPSGLRSSVFRTVCFGLCATACPAGSTLARMFLDVFRDAPCSPWQHCFFFAFFRGWGFGGYLPVCGEKHSPLGPIFPPCRGCS